LAVAQINTKYSALPPGVGVDSFSTTRAGWTLGGGLEYAFNANWTVRAEYRYSSFGNFRDTLAATAALIPAASARHNLNENAVRLGVAYKF